MNWTDEDEQKLIELTHRKEEVRKMLRAKVEDLVNFELTVCSMCCRGLVTDMIQNAEKIREVLEPYARVR